MVKQKQKRKPGKVAAAIAAARTLGSLGGRAGTTKQNEARKINAQRAGRPRRVCAVCNEPVVGGHVDRRLDASCGAHGWRWQRRDDPVDVADETRKWVRQLGSAVDDDAIVDAIVALFGRLSASRRGALIAHLLHEGK